MKNLLVIIMLLISNCLYAAGGSTASTASTNLSVQGSGEIVQGSAKIFEGGSKFVVASVESAAKFTEITLRSVANGSTIVIKVSAQTLGGVSLATGASIETVTTASGYLLTMGGKAIAFLPSEVGKNLIYSNPY